MWPFSSLDTAVFDSNIWILGITQKNETAEFLVQLVLKKQLKVYVSAYIYDEVFEAFNRSLNGSDVDRMKTKFANLVATAEYVDGPTQSDIERMDLERERNRHSVQMMGRVLDIQPKDVPIVYLAWRFRESEPHILTADEPFSQFDPQEHRLEEIGMKYIPVET